VPVVAIGFNWKRAHAWAANTAIVAGIAINFGVKLFNVSIPYGIDAGAVALIVSLTLFFLISFAMPQRRIDPDIDAVMDI
jgi:Na+/proline symporter